MTKEKIRNIQRLLQEQNIDTLLIGNFGHQVHDDLLYYVLLQQLELGVLFIPKTGRATLYAIPFEVPQLREAFSDITVLPLEKKLSELVVEHSGVIGYRPSSLPAKHFSESYVVLEHEDELMAIKQADEQVLLKKAAHITNAIFVDLIKHWNEFKTETDAASFILSKCIEYNVESSFPPIIASGKNAANPHHHPKHEVIQQGFCVIDMGVRYKGYCSDMTRTVYVGTPTADEIDAYEHLLDVQERAIAEVKAGATIADIAKNCRKNLKPEFEKHFTHSLGHGLGTQVHEWPRISKKEEVTLQAGMYITIEPGVYMPDAWGIRIEDDLLVNEGSANILTITNKLLVQV